MSGAVLSGGVKPERSLRSESPGADRDHQDQKKTAAKRSNFFGFFRQTQKRCFLDSEH